MWGEGVLTGDCIFGKHGALDCRFLALAPTPTLPQRGREQGLRNMPALAPTPALSLRERELIRIPTYATDA